MTAVEAARERSRHADGRFGEQQLTDPGQLTLGSPDPAEVTRFTDDDGITWIYGSPADPRPASASAAAEAGRITAAGDVAFVRSDVLGNEVEFEVRAFSSPFDAWSFAESQGCTVSQTNPDFTVDLFEPDSPRSCRLHLPMYT